MVDTHPTKCETFDLNEKINVDPKGFERAVDSYEVTDFGLYMARGADHPEFGYLESWLLPAVGLRANIFHYREGHERRQDYYFDVADITVDGSVWNTRDLYVDLISLTGEPLEVVDIDELSAATSAGLITAEDAERAIYATLRAVEGITRADDDAMKWLSLQGLDISWADHVTLAPAGA